MQSPPTSAGVANTISEMARVPSESAYSFTVEPVAEPGSAWDRFLSNRTLPWLAVAYLAALVLSLVLIANRRTDPGIVGLLLVLTTAPIAFQLAMRPSAQPIASDPASSPKIDQIARVLQEINSRATLSDDAVRILNRHNERDVLVKAIEEDIASEDWEPALILVRELADRCGYRVDAEDYRKRIDLARSQTMEHEVHEALAEFEQLLHERRWDLALADAARISRLFPDSSRTQGLRERVEHARSNYRVELEREFLLSAREGHAERALEILKEFDFYLTPEEAAPYQELVRGLVTKARENLGVEFKLAVQDRNWKLAADVGERVIAEFPNSRMAAEIREVIDQIRERSRP